MVIRQQIIVVPPHKGLDLGVLLLLPNGSNSAQLRLVTTARQQVVLLAK